MEGETLVDNDPGLSAFGIALELVINQMDLGVGTFLPLI